MITPNEQSLEIAARTLREKNLKRAGESIEIFRGFRKVEEHRLRMWHHAGAGGREVARQRSDLVDILFKELFEGVVRSVAPKGLTEPLVVAALGGYGRRELTPFSDVDIMFIISRSQPSKISEELIRKTLTTLWDIGYKVGHSTRSIAQTIKQANGDMVTKTSLLESRYLSGERELFAEFREQFENECVRGREGEYVSWRLANQVQTQTRYGGSVFMQEPNVKNGVGGLRDYHNMLWISYFKERINTTAKLVDARFLRDSERRALEKSYDFLLRVRTEMQYLTGRPVGQLTLQLQGQVAAGFNFPQRHILHRVEAFMREYYSQARNIHLITKFVIERMNTVPEKPGLFGIFRPKVEKFDGFISRGGKLYEESRDTFADDPYRLIRAFHHAQVRQLDFSTELGDSIRRRLRLVNRTFQYARVARETFLAILSRKGEVGRILREMHDLGFLGRYVPEFGALTCLVQHEFYHRYTADEHTLVCIEKLDGVLFAGSEKFRGYRAMFQKLEDPAMLYLALLLHDTGKTANKRHHEDTSAFLAQKVARRLQLSPERRRMLITLVNSHYGLSLTAQKRNLDDTATIVEFANIVANRANLDALMLLTLADGQGTSDQNWSDWKEGLVWTLYRRTTEYLEGGRINNAQLRKNLEDLREGVRGDWPRTSARRSKRTSNICPSGISRCSIPSRSPAISGCSAHSWKSTSRDQDPPRLCARFQMDCASRAGTQRGLGLRMESSAPSGTHRRRVPLGANKYPQRRCLHPWRQPGPRHLPCVQHPVLTGYQRPGHHPGRDTALRFARLRGLRFQPLAEQGSAAANLPDFSGSGNSHENRRGQYIPSQLYPDRYSDPRPSRTSLRSAAGPRVGRYQYRAFAHYD